MHAIQRLNGIITLWTNHFDPTEGSRAEVEQAISELIMTHFGLPPELSAISGLKGPAQVDEPTPVGKSLQDRLEPGEFLRQWRGRPDEVRRSLTIISQALDVLAGAPGQAAPGVPGRTAHRKAPRPGAGQGDREGARPG
jgi:hypothetical protein